MKKFLNVLSVFSLSVSPSLIGVENLNNTNTTLVEKNIVNKSLISGFWEGINVEHSKNTPPTGSHSDHDEESETTTALALEWETILKNKKNITAYGDFKLETYKKPRYLSKIKLEKNFVSSNSIKTVWKGKEENFQQTGWAKQTSRVELSVEAIYDSFTGTVGLTVKSYIYVKTAGAVHQCWVTSKVTKIDFN